MFNSRRAGAGILAVDLSSDQPPSGPPPGGQSRGGSDRRRRRGRGGRGGGGGQRQPQPAADAKPAPPPTAAPSGPGSRRGGRSGRGRQPAAGGQPQGQSPSRSGQGRRGQGRQAQGPPRPQPVPELEITDEKIFQRLLDGGLDLATEAIIQAFLYFPSEAPARRAAEELESQGYAAYADPSPPTRWVVEAVTRGVASPEAIGAMGVRLRALAQAGGGAYDGWWAFEVPEEEEAGGALAAPDPELEASLAPPPFDFELVATVDALEAAEQPPPAEAPPPGGLPIEP
ncbi:MAG: hypothetical protein NVS9B1_18130 [Candidatus Dormibacteraceae bacterium]